MSGSRKAPSPGKGSGKASGPKVARKERFRRILKWGLISSIVGALVMVAGFVYLYQTTPIPDPNADFQAETTYIYYSDGKTEIGHLATQNRDSLPLDEMPKCIQDAVVAAENRTFWTDNGIDIKGILRALKNNATGGPMQGASTITQQYVKILYLSQERTITRKIKEAILTLKIQQQLTKKQILEGYLNTIYFGRGAYGVQAAAQAYFRTDAKRLNVRQCAVLASVINNPSEFDPENGHDNKVALAERYHYVLDGMAEMNAITAAEDAKARKSLPKFPRQKNEDTYGGQRGHVLALVKRQLLDLGFSEQDIQGGGLRVTTTLTKEAMDAAEQGVKEQRPAGFSDKKLHIGVASVEPGTGALRGFYGGQDYLKSQLNWALAGGMAGSTFKAFALAAAITDGYSLKDTFQGNSPYTFPDGLEVNNEGSPPEDYGSHVSMVKAAEDSINTAFVDMTNSMTDGPQKVYDMAVSMGVPPAKAKKKGAEGFPTATRDLANHDTLITLGRARPSAVNMANAYATIANGGEAADVYVIEKVVDKNGNELYHHEVTTHRAVDENIDKDVSYALQQVVKSGTGHNAQALGRPAAGKTGTATGGSDNHVSSSWFVGYTPQLATAVMYVRGDGDDQLDGWLPSYFGADYPTRTWTDVMKRALEGQPVESFPPPANVDGNAPQTGHAPYVPPPPKTHKPKPSRSATPTGTLSPTALPSHTPPGQTKSPQPSPTETCTLIPPSCSSPSPSNNPSPSQSAATPPGNGNGKSGQPRQQLGRRRRRARLV